MNEFHGKQSVSILKEIRKSNLKKYLEKRAELKKRKRVVVKFFEKCDFIISSQLKQLVIALFPYLCVRVYLIPLRFLSRNDLFWFFFKDFVKYRIVKIKKEGIWAVELSKNYVYNNYKYDLKYFIKIQFSLGEDFLPVAFVFRRGSDNKFFESSELLKTEVEKILVCHFSRYNCGDSLREDLKYLSFLLQEHFISKSEYEEEKKNLQKEERSPNIYAPLPLSSKVLIKIENRKKTVMCIVGVIIILYILLESKRISNEKHTFNCRNQSSTSLSGNH